MDDFEAFTRDRIGRLRTEADALEKTLKEYVSARARKEGATRRSGGDNPRSGAFGVIMEAIAAAGPEGLTLDQMIDAAAEGGFEVKRNTLRSQIWSAKNDGAVEQVKTGVYRAPAIPGLGSGRMAFSTDLDDDMPEPVGGFSSAPPRRSPAEDFKGVKIPREDFTADLDDEIPF